MFVGGCVRKIIKNEKIDDIDIATTYKPKDVVKKLNFKNNLKLLKQEFHMEL